MTKEEALKAYEDRFGGVPMFLWTADAEYVVAAVDECLASGKEYEYPDEDADY